MRIKTNRRQTRVTTPLEKRLKDYSLAAAGIGVVAFAPPADAAVSVVPVGILLNPANVPSYTLKIGGKSLFNLNSNTFTDGINTTLASVTASSVRPSAKIFAHVGAMRQATLASAGAVPATLTSTTNPIFVKTSSDAGPIFSGGLGTKYLLFTFGTGPHPQYGWLELTITHSGRSGSRYQATVVRYAYESQAGVPLPAGATTDNSSPSPAPAPNSLWLLALGAAGIGGLEMLRRRRTA